MVIENVRVSKQGRDQLITLKRRTGISNWNILCRWAFCTSLAELSPPSSVQVKGENMVEMTWRTFGGEFADVYLALLKVRCKKDGIELSEENLIEQFRLHLHRGIGYLVSDPDIKSIAGLIRKAVCEPEKIV